RSHAEPGAYPAGAKSARAKTARMGSWVRAPPGGLVRRGLLALDGVAPALTVAGLAVEAHVHVIHVPAPVPNDRDVAMAFVGNGEVLCQFVGREVAARIREELALQAGAHENRLDAARLDQFVNEEPVLLRIERGGTGALPISILALVFTKDESNVDIATGAVGDVGRQTTPAAHRQVAEADLRTVGERFGIGV